MNNSIDAIRRTLWRTLNIQTTLLLHPITNAALPFPSNHHRTIPITMIQPPLNYALSIVTSLPSASMFKLKVSIPALSPISLLMQWVPLITFIVSSSPAVLISGHFIFSLSSCQIYSISV